MATKAGKDAKTRPNIVLLMSDDVGWGDLGCYMGGDNRGAATPHLDGLARDGLQFTSFYSQASCTAGRAATMTGRLPIRSGMTTVGFPNDGGGLPQEEVTVAEVLRRAGYKTCHIGKWHLGESDFALPINCGFDEMYNTLLYHLNAYTYNDPTFNPDFPPEYAKNYKIIGALEGKRGGKATETMQVTAKEIPFLDEISEKAGLAFLERSAKSDQPFFLYFNTVKMHQPNIPHPDFVGKSAVKSKYGDCTVELDTRLGRIIDKVRDLGLDDNTLIVFTTDNGAWQDVYPDCGYTPFRGTKGTDYEGGFRVPCLAKWPGRIEAGRHTAEIAGSLDFMATFAKLAGTDLPTTDNAGEPIIFDSFDVTPLLFGEGPSPRHFWLYQTETEYVPGAVRAGKWKAIWNIREGWKGQEDYVATVPEIFDLWQDPQERYDIFMNSWAEKTWTLQAANAIRRQVIDSYKKYPCRPLQGETSADSRDYRPPIMRESPKAMPKERQNAHVT